MKKNTSTSGLKWDKSQNNTVFPEFKNQCKMDDFLE